MQSRPLGGGFADHPTASAKAFRAILDVLAHPGKIAEISGATPPAPMSVAAGSLLLTLCDPETPVWISRSLQNDAVIGWLQFHTGAPVVTDRAKAMFAIGDWQELAPITDFAIGTAEYPDRSATLIVEMSKLVSQGAKLRGPGIQDVASLNLPENKAFADNASLFPLGLDFFFTANSSIAALPRSTKLGE